MKKSMILLRIAFLTVLSTFLFVGCGRGGEKIVTNEYLGDLPSIAKNYTDKMETKEQELKVNTDFEKAFTLAKEGELLEDEAEKTIEEHLIQNPIHNIPFQIKGDYPFTINDISVIRSSDSRIEFKADVAMTKDVPKKIFVYIKAIDKEGNQLTRKNGVMGEISFKKRSFKANEAVAFSGSLDGPADMVNFDKLVFISKEEYKN